MKTLLLLLISFPFRLRNKFYVYWNRFFFYLHNIKFGKNLIVSNHVYLIIGKKAKIHIGDNFRYASGSGYNPLSRNIKGAIYAVKNASVIIGNNVRISSTSIMAKEEIRIDDNVRIGGDTIIMDTDAHNLDWRIRNNRKIDSSTAKTAPIHIKESVFIGTRCIILKGVTIGEHSVIGSGSVVTKDVPANCIAAGNPAKVIKCVDEWK
jgi:acetyltransferase-like isoleucine patch superfamily enzyme